MGSIVCHWQLAHYEPDVSDPTHSEGRLTEDCGDEPSLRKSLRVDRPTRLDLSGVPNARWVAVTNRSGASETHFPTAERAAAIAAAVLRVGFGAGGGTPPPPDQCGVRLLPAIPGQRNGTGVPLPIAPDVEIWVAPEAGEPVDVQILIVPGM